MIELFQITGSASFAARASLEEAGAEYVAVDVNPRRRDETPALAIVNPLEQVPSLRDGEVTVYETSAVLQYIAERFPAAGLAPPPGDPVRGAYLRWMAWLGNTLHGAWQPLNIPSSISDDPAAHASIGRTGRRKLDAIGAYLETELAGTNWCLGDGCGHLPLHARRLAELRRGRLRPRRRGGRVSLSASGCQARDCAGAGARRSRRAAPATSSEAQRRQADLMGQV